MSQHDLEITNADANTGASVRAQLNAALQALGSLQSGATAPTTTYAYMLWADTTTGLLKMRNGANDAWITIADLTKDYWGLAFLVALNEFSASQKIKGDALLLRFKDTGGGGKEWALRSDNGYLEICENTGTEGSPTWTTRASFAPAGIGRAGEYVNLIIKNNATNPAYQIDVDADSIIMEDASGNLLKKTAVDWTLDITVSGANGLDTGSEAISTWYYIWAIGKLDGTVAGLFSTSSSAPTMPSGYTFKALVGAIYNNSSGDFITLRQRGDRVVTENISVLNNGSATSWTAINLAAAIPPNAWEVNIHFQLGTSTYMTEADCYLSPDSTISPYTRIRVSVGSGANAAIYGSQWLSLITASNIYYKIATTNTALSLYVIGWRFSV